MSSPGSGPSPAWKNPRERLRRFASRRNHRRKLEMDSNSGPTGSVLHVSSSQPAFPTTSKSILKTKRNPFRVSPKKKLRKVNEIRSRQNENYDFDQENAQFPDSNPLLGALEVHDSEEISCNSANCPAFALQTDFSSLILQQNNHSSTPKTKIEENPVVSFENSGDFVPIDMRLCSQIRITSSEPFPWIEDENLTGNLLEINAADRAKGVEICSKGATLTMELDPDLSPEALLHAFSLYWITPSCPWMKLFPRIEREQRLSAARDQKTPSIATLGNVIEEKIYNEWQSSFEQLYQSFTSGLCIMFYVCCPAMTILFVNCANDTNPLKAVITPTTHGIRQLLKDEGVDYEMPMRTGSRRTSRGSSMDSNSWLPEDITQSQPPFLSGALQETQSCFEPPNKNDSCDDDALDTSGEVDKNLAWLTDLGVSPGIREKLKRCKSNSDRYSTGSGNGSGLWTDDPAKTVVVVSGVIHVNGLYNLLHNNKQMCQAMTGPQAGLPPTLIAPSPFHGATLKSLKLESRVIHKNTDRRQYLLEVTGGPILPCTSYGICSLLKDTINTYTVSCGGNAVYPGINSAIKQNVTNEQGSTGFGDLIKSCNFYDAQDFKFENGVFKW